MDEIIIRPMRRKDCEQVAQIDKKCIQNFWSLEDFEGIFRYPENYYFVAEQQNRIIGFVGLIQFFDDGDITHIAVDKEYRRLGVASKLLQELFSFVQSRKFVALHLEVRKSNMAAKQLYLKYGFEEIGIRRKYYTNPVEDAIVMVKHFK